jgi:hypothetical protein
MSVCATVPATRWWINVGSDTTPAWEEKATRRIGDICRLPTHRCLRVEADGAVRRGPVIDAST